MESKYHFPIMEGDDCDCCQTNGHEADAVGKGYGCHERKTVLTHREEAVLHRIRQLGLEARVLRDRLRQYEAEPSIDLNERQRVMKDLENLRQLRSELELERIAAAEERMRLLGHA